VKLVGDICFYFLYAIPVQIFDKP